MSSRYRAAALLDARVPSNSEKRWYRDNSSFVLKNTKDFLNFKFFSVKEEENERKIKFKTVYADWNNAFRNVFRSGQFDRAADDREAGR